MACPPPRCVPCTGSYNDNGFHELSCNLQPASKMSTDLQWLIVRKWNSFQRKAATGPIFSAEKVSFRYELRPIEL